MPDELTERFAELVARDGFPLDEASLLVAAHGDPRCDIDRALGQLDALAAAVGSPAVPTVTESLFGAAGFTGDQHSYYDPRNSYLHEVLDRRRGIPITLSIVLIEVGRRIGVPMRGVSTPAHFVVATEDGRYVDAFGGGRIIDRDSLADLFDRLTPGVDLEPFLEPVSAVDVIRRVLGNLVGVHRRRNDRNGLRWASELLTLIPGATGQDRRTYAGALAACGRFDRAAGILEALVEAGDAADAAEELAAAERLRARLN